MKDLLKIKMLWKVIIFAVFVTNSSFAQIYQISELLDIAQKNSQNIRFADNLSKAQLDFAKQQKYWNNPIISINRIGGQNNYSITQAIPFYGKLKNRYNIEEAESEILGIRKKSLVLSVKSDLFKLIYQYEALKQKIQLAKKRVDRLSLIDKYLAAIELNSPTKKAQSQITKDRIKLVERDLIRLSNEVYQIWNLMNVYLGLETEPDQILFKWLSEENYQDKNFFIASAMENNLELKEQKLAIKKYNSELSYAKIEQMPDFNVSAIKETGSNSAAIGSGSSSNSNNGIGLSVSVPLINRNQGKISSVSNKIKAQEASLGFQRTVVEKEIKNAFNEYETSLKLAKNFPINNINKIIYRLLEANSDFKRGTLDFITYIELDLQEYQMIDAIFDAQIGLANSYADLMNRVGNFALPFKD